MKRIVYSPWLKVMAAILLIASVTCGVLAASHGVISYDKEETEIYSLERDFSESWYLSYLLHQPEQIIHSVYYDVFYPYDETNFYASYGKNGRLDAVFTRKLRESFQDFKSEEVHYFVQWNEQVFTNCGANRAVDLMQGEYYSYVKRESGGNIERFSTIYDEARRGYLLETIETFDMTSTIVVACSVKEDVAKEYRALWERQRDLVLDAASQSLACALVAILLLIYLICVCGKNKNGEHENLWTDNIWLEGHVLLMAGFGIAAVAACIFAVEEYAYASGYFKDRLIYWIIGGATALGSLVILCSLLSILRNIKIRRLMETSIILRLLRWLLRFLVKIAKWLWKLTRVFFTTLFRAFTKKSGALLLDALILYSLLLSLCGIGTAFSPVWLIFGFLLLGFGCFFLAWRGKELEAIKKGVSQVRSGELSYKIPQPKCEDLRRMAEDLNDIAKGLDESLTAKVKAERLKSELITNVSHDLKTPITSIISYTELLSKVENLPQEARDYVAVIAKKGDRLKRLTQDLFDISKVQSGNDEILWEKLDTALLVNQALAEFDNEIQASALTFCLDMGKELYISADGRKMSRVLSNLIHNILKYAMKNTRVFFSAKEKDGKVELELKNISAYPLNFDVEEITQRFVRGDESRTAEGNGLGLAIAKSYTELCGGSLEIVTDGDLFKAILRFSKYE